MTKINDMTKTFSDMMASLPIDATAFQNAFKTQAAFGEKLSKVALEAAEKSTEISSKWAKETIAKLTATSKAKSEPNDYTKAASDFASAAAELAAENLAAFAEVAKKVQVETVELLMAAGKSASEDATDAVKKASADVANVAKKVTIAA